MSADLKMLVELCPGTRLPQFEDEIFSTGNRALSDYYVRKLCTEFTWFDEAHVVPYLIYRYSRDVLHGRWVAAEPTLMEDIGWTVIYSHKVICGRWPEAEKAISLEATFKVWYDSYFGTNI